MKLISWNSNRKFQIMFHFLCSKFQVPSSKSKGFTLLETIIALGVILAGIVGPFTLATSGIIAAASSKNKLVALNLAQEGIELVRKIRDDNKLARRQWDTGFEREKDGAWLMDITDGNSLGITCNDTNPIPLNFNANSGLYVRPGNPAFISGTPSLFARCVYIQHIPNGASSFVPGIPTSDQVRVISKVWWNEGVIQRNVSLEETLYNWQ